MIKAHTKPSKKQIEAVRAIACENIKEYEAQFGLGPCGILAELLCEAGWGEVGYCETAPAGYEHTVRGTDEDCRRWYPHYVIVNNGKIIDVSGEYVASATPKPIYRDLEVCGVKGIDPLWGDSDRTFWAPKLQGVI
jgi:hypothetical protein